jgi:hypothetical protein
MNGAAFLREVIVVFPYAIHTVLSDNALRGEGKRRTSQQVSVRECALAA